MEISAAKFSKANVYFCGALLNTAAGLALGLVVNPSFGWLIPMAILLGVGTSTTIIQTYAIAAEVFGQDEQTSGFCFGVMGIFEKAVSGGVVIGIQERVPTRSMVLAGMVTLVIPPKMSVKSACFTFNTTVLDGWYQPYYFRSNVRTRSRLIPTV